MSKKCCSKCKKNLLIECFITETHNKPYSCCHDCRLKLVSQINKCNVCGITAVFNMKGKKNGIKCSQHKEPEMINVRNKCCTYKDCTTLAIFGFENDKVLFCAKHKDPTMTYLHKKKCNYENCSKKPCYGIEDKNPIFCKEHKTENMVDVSHKKCKYENCKTRPSYGLKDGPLLFCAKHKTDEMKELVNKRCEKDKCDKNPTYNFNGEKNPRFCKDHRLENMIDIKHKLCLENGCKKRPTFNFLTEKSPIYCREHKKDGMNDICNKRCSFKDCTSQPKFNFEGLPTKFCFKHKEEGMINLVFTSCKESNCQKHPNYNYENENIGIYCAEHKLENMVDVKHAFCKTKDCRKRANFNLSGLLPAFCATHKKEGMLSNPRRKCIECKENATHGIKEPLHCEVHSTEDEYNLTEHSCKKCERIDVLNKAGLCVNFCSLEERDRIIKKQVKKHEEFINKLLDQEIDIKPILKDESPDRQCTLKRPDRVYHMGSHVVIVEVDEDQHKSYKCTAYGDTKEGKMKAERVRMYEISQSFAEFPPCIWIRYNPDNFKDENGKPVKIITSKRHDILVKWVKRCLRDEKTVGVKVKYLFYDEYKETDGIFDIIEKEEVLSI